MAWDLVKMFIASFLGSVGFGLTVHVPKRSLVPAGILSGGVFAVYWLLCQWGLKDAVAVFVACMAGSFLSLIFARKMQMIGTIFLMMCIISFVPGLGLYRSMQAIGMGQTGHGASILIEAMITIAMIVLGLGSGSLLYKVIFSGKSSHHG